MDLVRLIYLWGKKWNKSRLELFLNTYPHTFTHTHTQNPLTAGPSQRMFLLIHKASSNLLITSSSTQQTWVWVNSRRSWRAGKPGMMQSMGSQSQTWLSDWKICGYTYFYFYSREIFFKKKKERNFFSPLSSEHNPAFRLCFKDNQK